MPLAVNAQHRHDVQLLLNMSPAARSAVRAPAVCIDAKCLSTAALLEENNMLEQYISEIHKVLVPPPCVARKAVRLSHAPRKPAPGMRAASNKFGPRKPAPKHPDWPMMSVDVDVVSSDAAPTTPVTVDGCGVGESRTLRRDTRVVAREACNKLTRATDPLMLRWLMEAAPFPSMYDFLLMVQDDDNDFPHIEFSTRAWQKLRRVRVTWVTALLQRIDIDKYVRFLILVVSTGEPQDELYVLPGVWTGSIGGLCGSITNLLSLRQFINDAFSHVPPYVGDAFIELTPRMTDKCVDAHNLIRISGIDGAGRGLFLPPLPNNVSVGMYGGAPNGEGDITSDNPFVFTVGGEEYEKMGWDKQTGDLNGDNGTILSMANGSSGDDEPSAVFETVFFGGGVEDEKRAACMDPTLVIGGKSIMCFLLSGKAEEVTVRYGKKYDEQRAENEMWDYAKEYVPSGTPVAWLGEVTGGYRNKLFTYTSMQMGKIVWDKDGVAVMYDDEEWALDRHAFGDIDPLTGGNATEQWCPTPSIIARAVHMAAVATAAGVWHVTNKKPVYVSRDLKSALDATGDPTTDKRTIAAVRLFKSLRNSYTK